MEALPCDEHELCWIRLQRTTVLSYAHRLHCGLSRDFPSPEPVVDCTPYSECLSCTSIPNCAFCYDTVLVDGLSGKPAILGTCADFGDATATARCPGANRFYIEGQCAIPLNPGCKLDTNGACVVEHVYNDSNANVSKMRFALGWLICVPIFLALIILAGFNDRIAPYYGKQSFYPLSDLPHQLLALFAVVALEIGALATNEFSFANNEDSWHSFGMFGEYVSAGVQNMYKCNDTNEDVNLAFCYALPAASVITAILGLTALLAAFARLVAAVITAQVNGRIDHKPHDTWYWRVDLIGCVCSGGAVLVWTSAHLIIEQTMIAPSNGGPHDTLHIGTSWVLQICCALVHTYACAIYAVEITTADPPPGWTAPGSVAKTPAELELASAAEGDQAAELEAQRAKKVLALNDAREEAVVEDAAGRAEREGVDIESLGSPSDEVRAAAAARAAQEELLESMDSPDGSILVAVTARAGAADVESDAEREAREMALATETSLADQRQASLEQSAAQLAAEQDRAMRAATALSPVVEVHSPSALSPAYSPEAYPSVGLVSDRSPVANPGHVVYAASDSQQQQAMYPDASFGLVPAEAQPHSGVVNIRLAPGHQWEQAEQQPPPAQSSYTPGALIAAPEEAPPAYSEQ
jgi:hypothetical protein